jgi:hypothetical protein
MKAVYPDDVFDTLDLPTHQCINGGAKVHLNEVTDDLPWAGKTWPKSVQNGAIRFIPQYHGAGDVIMATALLKKARDMFPKAELIFQCKRQFACLLPDYVMHEPLGESAREVQEEIVVSYYDCWQDGESALARMGGVAEDMFLPELPTVEVSEKSVGFWVRQGSNPNKIKEWDDENWKELAFNLSRRGFTCYQLGGIEDNLILSGDIKDLRKEALVDSLGTLAAVDVVVTIDGVAQHACRALDKQAIVLWGGSCTPEVIGYPEHVNLTPEHGKRCWGSVCQSTYQQGDCCGDGSCMDAPVALVQEHVEALMGLGD